MLLLKYKDDTRDTSGTQAQEEDESENESIPDLEIEEDEQPEPADGEPNDVRRERRLIVYKHETAPEAYLLAEVWKHMKPEDYDPRLIHNVIDFWLDEVIKPLYDALLAQVQMSQIDRERRLIDRKCMRRVGQVHKIEEVD